MTHWNTLRFAVSATTLTIAYICVVVGSGLMSLTDLISGSTLEHTSLSDWWNLYTKELELIRQVLL